MKFARWLLALAALAALVLLPIPVQPVASAMAAQAALSAGADGPPDRDTDHSDGNDKDRHRGHGLCRPDTPDNAPPTTQFFAGNSLFGPAQLPTARPVGPLLAGYQRFGALSQEDFLNQYTTPENRNAYRFPPAFGFFIAPDGRPIKTAFELQSGYRIDRFGFPGGEFLSPVGTPFSQRALPPSNLNTPANAPLSNYHIYCVIRSFKVDAGPVAPWFAQPGMGTQYRLNAAYLPQAGTALTVTWLLQHHYLVEETLNTGDDQK